MGVLSIKRASRLILVITQVLWLSNSRNFRSLRKQFSQKFRHGIIMDVVRVVIAHTCLTLYFYYLGENSDSSFKDIRCFFRIRTKWYQSREPIYTSTICMVKHTSRNLGKMNTQVPDRLCCLLRKIATCYFLLVN